MAGAVRRDEAHSCNTSALECSLGRRDQIHRRSSRSVLQLRLHRILHVHRMIRHIHNRQPGCSYGRYDRSCRTCSTRHRHHLRSYLRRDLPHRPRSWDIRERCVRPRHIGNRTSPSAVACSRGLVNFDVISTKEQLQEAEPGKEVDLLTWPSSEHSKIPSVMLFNPTIAPYRNRYTHGHNYNCK